MTVGELIKILSQYDKDSEVTIFDYEYNEESMIISVDFLNKKIVLFYD